MQLAKMGLERWHVCPYPGGLFDQPWELLQDVIRLTNLANEIQSDSEYTDTDYEPVDIGDEATPFVRM